ncbi:protein of unknown function (plasmid) [Cupriavidus neocaledonicus]|uniref:Uncharacterized protein n=1 Tax=Cupriavidus neocaledonicus TaxID=1040979 RepID=A0A375HQG0_9BURK|nr:hypothetical protein CBM2605_B110220 [Cupriavidus neocaledonicus]SPD59665.1 protein of unknown function [Cupriavidus neocaledonicus]
MQVDGDVPGPGRQRLDVDDVMEQRQVREELPQSGRRRDRVMRHPVPRHGGACNAEQDCRGKRHHQFLVAAPQHRQRMLADLQPSAGCQAARRQEAADHQEHLHRDAGVVIEPVHQPRRQLVGGVGHRSIEGEVVQDDQLRTDGFQGVDARQSRRAGAHCYRENAKSGEGAILPAAPALNVAQCIHYADWLHSGFACCQFDSRRAAGGRPLVGLPAQRHRRYADAVRLLGEHIAPIAHPSLPPCARAAPGAGAERAASASEPERLLADPGRRAAAGRDIPLPVKKCVT